MEDRDIILWAMKEILKNREERSRFDLRTLTESEEKNKIC